MSVYFCDFESTDGLYVKIIISNLWVTVMVAAKQ
jgi:hypothetical protein